MMKGMVKSAPSISAIEHIFTDFSDKVCGCMKTPAGFCRLPFGKITLSNRVIHVVSAM